MRDQHLFYIRFAERIDEMVKYEKDALTTGSAEDYTNYRERVARITALLDALEEADEVQKILLGGK